MCSRPAKGFCRAQVAVRSPSKQSTARSLVGRGTEQSTARSICGRGCRASDESTDGKRLGAENYSVNKETHKRHGTTPVCKNEDKPKPVLEQNGDIHTFQFPKFVVHVYRKDITDCQVDVIVSSENKYGDSKRGVSQAIAKASKQNLKDVHNIPRQGSENGSFVFAEPGNLQMRGIFYAIVYQFNSETGPSKDDLHILYKMIIETLHVCNTIPDEYTRHRKNVFGLVTRTSEKRKVEKVAIPMLGAGALSKDKHIEMCCREMYNALEHFSGKDIDIKIKEVHLVDINIDRVNAITEYFQLKLDSTN